MTCSPCLSSRGWDSPLPGFSPISCTWAAVLWNPSKSPACCSSQTAEHGDQRHGITVSFALNVISFPRCVCHYCFKIKLTWWKIMSESILSSSASSYRSWTPGVNLVLISETLQGRNVCWIFKQLGLTGCQRTLCSLVVYLRSFSKHNGVQYIYFSADNGEISGVCAGVFSNALASKTEVSFLLTDA